MATTRWPTALTVLNQAASELGQTESSDPYAESGAFWVQLRALLNRAGKHLVKLREWPQLVKQYTFPTVSGTTAYDLPADFASMIDQSGWNQTDENELKGPISPQRWEYLDASGITPTISIEFRQAQGKLWVFDPPNAQTIAFEYQGRAWVVPTGQTAPANDTATAITDAIWFDELLIVALLVLFWREAKEEDTTIALARFKEELDLASAASTGGRVLDLGGSAPDFHFIDGSNVPDTGYGL